MSGLLGSITSGLAAGVPGALLGLFSGGGGEANQSTRTRLRGLTSGERKLMSDSVAGLRGLGTGPYSQDIFNMLYNPAAEDTRRTFGRERGRTNFMFASTGGGPSSVRNSAARSIAAEESRALGRLRGDTAGYAAGLTSGARRDLLGTYSAILGGQNVGAGQDVYFPQDNRNSLLSLGMDALVNKDSWWNSLGFNRGGGGGGGGGGSLFAPRQSVSLPPVDPRLLGFGR